MKLSIPKDRLLNPVPPRVFLCNTASKILGQLNATSISLNAKWRQYGELSFEIQRTYVDLVTGQTKVHPLYDKVEAPRNVYLEGYGLFCLQDIDDTSGDGDTKSVTAFSLEYATSNKYLTSFHINTGEIDSAEVLYNEKEFGIDYNTDRDSFYKFASGEFDAFERYYQRQYTDNESYTYEQVQISNATEYNEKLTASNNTDQPSQKLYMKKFPNVQFYNRNKTGLSLLHLIFENIPEWQIGDVDQSLWHKERRFSEDRISIYDFLMNNVSETFGCAFVWDSDRMVVDVFEEVEDDEEVDNEAFTRFETDVYISKDNLASECKVQSSSDNIKTKLVVTGAEGLDIREVNLGSNEIMDLSYYHTEDWMETDLFERYSEYLLEIEEAQTGLDANDLPSEKYPTSYPDAMQGWVSANNRYNELMNAVPSESNVLLVGDEFRELFCVYSPIDSAYVKDITITSETKTISDLYYDEKCNIKISDMKDGSTYIVQGFKLTYSSSSKKFNVGDYMVTNSMGALVKKLNQYHVYEDVQGNKSDNILLKLKNSKSDVVTIRIYDPKTKASVYNENYGYYTKNSNNTYTRISNISNQTELDNYGADVYTNNYTIQSVIYYASSDTTSAPSYWSMTIEDINGSAPKSFSEWVKGALTAEEMGLVNYDETDTEHTTPLYYTVSHIGTMGSYFVLAKDEIVVQDDGVLQTSANYLNSCGVNLLREKHKIYTTLFQTQTEAMFSQEKYQCIIQDTQPTGVYKDGTRWLDSNAKKNEPLLYVYKAATSTSSAHWEELRVLNSNNVEVSANPTDDELYSYENYQRYLDNFNKLKAVQTVLTEKERVATYYRDGYPVEDMSIKWQTQEDGSSMPENFDTIIMAHFRQFGEEHTYGNNQFVDAPWIIYTFTTSYDPYVYTLNTKPYNAVEQYYIKPNPKIESYTPVTIDSQSKFNEYNGSTDAKKLYVISSGHTFAVYIKDNKPYVSYANSEGIYNMIMEYIRDKTSMIDFFNEGDMWARLSPLIKEDEYNDSNFLLTGYESEEERMSIAKELMDAAKKELKAICKPSLEFSMTMSNILALPEFEPLVEYFQLGNFIRVAIRDEYVRRARLLEVNINFDDLSDFSATFGNLVSVKSEVDRHAELLSRAVTAGKTVAKSATTWQKTVEKANQIETDIANGLKDRAISITSASGQHVTMDSGTGLHIRKFKDGSTTEYEPEEIAIINNSIVATNDSWLTAKSAFGKYKIGDEERWGPIAEYVTADTIEGKLIRGGAIEIGTDKTKFIVNEDGSVEIRSDGVDYMNAMTSIDNAYRFSVVLDYEGLTVFSDTSHTCIITCDVYDYKEKITDKIIENETAAGNDLFTKTFVWTRTSNDSLSDSKWKPTYVDDKPNQIEVSVDDVAKNSQFKCQVEFDETKFQNEKTENN